MKVRKLKDLSQKDYQRIVKRSAGINADIMPKVQKTMENVRKYGDKVLVANYKKRFGENNYTSLSVSKKEIKQAYKEVSKEFIAAIMQTIKNITAVHAAQPETVAAVEQLPAHKNSVSIRFKGAI